MGPGSGALGAGSIEAGSWHGLWNFSNSPVIVYYFAVTFKYISVRSLKNVKILLSFSKMALLFSKIAITHVRLDPWPLAFMRAAAKVH